MLCTLCGLDVDRACRCVGCAYCGCPIVDDGSRFCPSCSPSTRNKISNRLEILADNHLCGGRAARVLARFEYLVANLLDGYGLRKSLSEFVRPPYGA